MSKEKILREFMTEVWNEQKKDLISKYVSKEYKIHLDPGDNWEGQILDHKEFERRLDFSFDSFPDINFEITSAIEDGNHVAVTWVLTGTNTGPIAEHQPSNKKIKTTGMTFYYFRDNLISGHSQVFDRGTVAKQLGFI